MFLFSLLICVIVYVFFFCYHLCGEIKYIYKKILLGLVDARCADMFLCDSKTRGHNMKLCVQSYRCSKVLLKQSCTGLEQPKSATSRLL